MQYQEVHIFKFGENSWILQWQSSPSKTLLQFLLAVKENILNEFDAEVIHTYTEILVKNTTYSYVSEDELKDRFREIIKTTQPQDSNASKTHRIPVCYDPSLGEDLEIYLKLQSLHIDQLIEMHTKPLYTIYFMGFLPGFPYLDGLDKRLYLERKSIPSQKVQRGSVAIGGKQTGIYPQDSPGGWYTIGHTPISLFDVTKSQPSPFMLGDSIKFYAIDVQEHTRIQKEIFERNAAPITRLYDR